MKSILKPIGGALIFLLSGTQLFAAAPQDTLKKINANRSLLSRYEADYERLKSEYALNVSSLKLKRELENVRLKVKALNEDSAALLKTLPEETKADELVKYVLARENLRNQLSAQKAAESLSPAVKTTAEPEDPYSALHERALWLVSESRYEEAVSTYEEILLINPEDDQAYMILGHLFVMTGQFGRAERAFYNAAEIDPDNHLDIVPFYRGQTLKNPDDDAAHSQLGYVYMMFRDLEAAKQAFEDALLINPASEPAAKGLELLAALNP